VTVEVNETTYEIGATFGAGPRGPQGEKGDTGANGATGPAGLNWRLAWDDSTQYAIDDAVYYSGSSYYAVAVPDVGTAPDPDLTTPWMELAIMGQKGDKGDTGATGATGAGVPDTSGATSGDVVKYNGTMTEWGTLDASDVGALPDSTSIPDSPDDIGAASATEGGAESVAAGSATTGTVTLDCSTASVFTITPTGDFTLSPSNVPASGTACTITVIITMGSTLYDLTMPDGAIWLGGAPTLVASKTAAVTMLTTDGGDTWVCSAGVES
jgi:hypothetical protein